MLSATVIEEVGKPFVGKYSNFLLTGKGKVYLSFEAGFEPGFHRIDGGAVVGGYSFSDGLAGTTLEFSPAPYVAKQPILDVEINTEADVSNGLGVDCFSLHGTSKEILKFTLFLFGGEVDRGFHPSDQPKIGVAATGLFCYLSAEYQDPVVPENFLLFLNQPFYPMGQKVFAVGTTFDFFSASKEQRLSLTFLIDE